MGKPAKKAILRLSMLALFQLFLASPRAFSEQSSAAATVDEARPWIVGIARFEQSDTGGYAPSVLLDTIPRLIAGNLSSLPRRLRPESDTRELAELASLRARYSAGSDLSDKLDERAAKFFDDGIGGWVKEKAIKAADAKVTDSAKKLAGLVEKSVDDGVIKPEEFEAQIWSGHGSGKLIEAHLGNLAQAAKGAGVDLLVYGSVALKSSYAVVVVRGFDAALGREVFSWKSFCAVDDPLALAAEFASKLEDWIAGRKVGRLELKIEPPYARLRVNGQLQPGDSRVIYAYEDKPLVLALEAAGYESLVTETDLALGEKKSIELKLRHMATGVAIIGTDPPDANLSLDSEPLGHAPVSIVLDGSRAIVEATSSGYESAGLVLPAKGDSNAEIRLQLSDGLGPSGRIAIVKDRFYDALGLFALSIPLTAIGSGLYNQYYEAYSRTGASALYDPGIATWYAFGACIGLSCATGAYMIFRLVQYLKEAK